MSDYISREAASADECKHKIKTPFAKIIVGGTPKKPCYTILYFDPADGKCHIGFGSYRLDYVFRWLAEEFEVTEPCADVEPVRCGRWIQPSWIYYGAKQYVCDQCKDDEYWRKHVLNYKEKYCPNCGAKMFMGDNCG